MPLMTTEPVASLDGFILHSLLRQADQLHHAGRLISFAVAEGRNQQQARGAHHFGSAWTSDAAVQRVFGRLSAGLEALLKPLETLGALARSTRDAEVMLMLGEVEALLEGALDEQGLTLGHWGLRNRGGRWEVDFLELDYHLRAHMAELLDALEAFVSTRLVPFTAAVPARLRAEALAATELAG